MYVSGEDDPLVASYLGKARIGMGFVEPGGPFQNDDSLSTQAGDFLFGVGGLKSLEIGFREAADVRGRGH